MRRLLIAAPIVLLVAACSTDTTDFKDQTESFINDSSDVAGIFDGADVSNASCEEPTSKDVGTTYVCTADVEGVGSVTFDGLIDAEDSFTITPRP